MRVVAELGLGEVLWSLLVIFFMVVYFMAFFYVIVDLFRDRESSGFTKAIWIIALLVLPMVSLLAYLIVRGDGMAKRQAAEVATAQAALDEHVKAVAQSSPADQIAKAKELHDQGVISDDEYAALKAKALA